MRPFYRGVCLIEVPVKRESTVHDILYDFFMSFLKHSRPVPTSCKLCPGYISPSVASGACAASIGERTSKLPEVSEILTWELSFSKAHNNID